MQIDNEPRWISCQDYAAAMVPTQSGTHFSSPMFGRTSTGEEIPFVTASVNSEGVTWSHDVNEVLVEPHDRARGWLIRPLW